MKLSKVYLLIFPLSFLAFNFCSKNNDSPDDPSVEQKYFFNPLLLQSAADPTVIDDRERTGYFYAYATGAKLPVYRSEDMYYWEKVADGYSAGAPDWVEGGSGKWAPDINYVNGKYVLYYALGASTPEGSGSELLKQRRDKCGCGVALADHPEGPFIDQGMVVDYATTGVSNSIDPMLFIDGDKMYLYWGSFGVESGIWVVELEDSGLKVKKGAKPVQIGANNMEGSYVIKRDGYYYYFGSKGSCCSGGESTYHIIVARSESPFGPFVNKKGVLLTSSSYDQTIMQSSSDNVFRGTGHNAQIIKDDAGNEYMYYHSYHSRNNYAYRVFCMDQIVWDKDGWPYFKYGDTPSRKCPIPTIIKKK